MRKSSITHLILDADGVLWDVEVAKPGIREFFACLRRKSIKFIVATNIARYAAEHFTKKFKNFGIDVASEEIITSPQATAEYVKREAPDARIFVCGEQGLIDELEHAGLKVINNEWTSGRWKNPPTHVVAGLDTTLTYKDKIAPAHHAIKDHGAVLIATNPDRTSRHSSGASYPGGGAVAALLEYSTGKKAIVIGKPQTAMFEVAMERMGAEPETTAVVGDNLETEIAAGWKLGLTTWFVLSGVTSRAEVEAAERRPDKVFEDIREITEYLENSQ